MKKTLGFAALMSLALAAPAEAARPSYSFAEAAFLQSKSDVGSGDAQGPRIGLNVSLARWAYATGGYELLDRENSSTESGLSSLGFGVHTLKSTFQIFAAGTYERRDINRETSSDSTDEGYGVQLGVRLPIRSFELQGDYKYSNFGDLPSGKRDDDDRYRALVLAHLTPKLALTGSYETFEQTKVDQWTVGLRVYFNNRHDATRKKRAAPAPAGLAQPEAEAQ